MILILVIFSSIILAHNLEEILNFILINPSYIQLSLQKQPKTEYPHIPFIQKITSNLCMNTIRQLPLKNLKFIMNLLLIIQNHRNLPLNLNTSFPNILQ